MQIVELYAENLKRIRVVRIRPEGPLVQITGANASGKSSVLDAFYFALAGKRAADPQPVRRGEAAATIRLDLGEIVVTRQFNAADDTTSLVVEAASGARFPSPQTMLDQLFGSLTFDPLEFTRMDAKAKSVALRQLVKLEIDVEELGRLNATDYAARRDTNREAVQLTPRVKALAEKIPKDMPARVDLGALLEDMRGAADHNAAVERQVFANDREDSAIERTRRDLEDMDRRIEALRNERLNLERTLNFAEAERGKRPPVPEPINTGELAQRIEAGQATNRAADEVARAATEHADLVKKLAALVDESNTLTAKMDGRTAEIRAAIAGAKMPVDGLSFSDTFDVLFGGLPFEQASGAEQLRVSVAIAMAMNPRLRVLRIKDGSLLDESNLAAIADMATAGDYQIWVERVDTSGRVGVVMEDGTARVASGG